ncbi:MAG: hypothetical protein M1436_05585 [Acidobacteria bacterium]|nr:hypothetical protein [Acidobacteriota bacterium]
MKKYAFAVFALALALASAPLYAQQGATLYSSNNGVSWPATDGLGRVLPSPAEVGAPKPNRFVGIFYFLWLGQHDRTEDGPYVVTDILRKFPDALHNSATPPWGPQSSPHFWGEPLYGFYLNSDPWILRRHAHLLSDAGIDTLIFDTTNRATYHQVYLQLAKVFQQMREEGERTPQMVFMVNTEAGETAQDLYEDLYKPGLYKDLWFMWNGKPLLICDPEKASPEVKAFFTLRRAHWPFNLVNTQNAWHWESAYPQVYGFTDDPNKPEQVNVAVAQNLNVAEGKVTNMSSGNARGRSFHDGKEDTSPGAVNHGYNFQEQWKRALELAPPFVMVTGWNEWIAGRFTRGKEVVFVDQFSQEYSRDIEPMKGGHNDNYYYQLVANVRRFKGMEGQRKAAGAKTIDLKGGFAQWRDVGPEYWDHIGETIPRDYDGVAKTHYINRTGRNDFDLAKVTRDAENVYFYVRTHEPITPRTGDNWMTLLIDADANAKTGWQGYDYLVNGGVLEKNAGGWNWTKAGQVIYNVKGNEMQLAIPRTALGLPTGRNAAVQFDFKWTDNLQKPGDIMDFYLSGDVAPDGRFNYRYTTK